MRTALTLIAVLMFSMVVFADDKEKKAKAAFAFEQQKVKQAADVGKVDRVKQLFQDQCKDCEVAKHECQCHDTSKSDCKPSACLCCNGKLQDYAIQIKKAEKQGLVIVAFFGTQGRGACFNGAISASGDLLAGRDRPVILVGYGAHGSVLISDELPVEASRVEIEAAVKRAQTRRDAAAKPVEKAPAPVVAPVIAPETATVPSPNWFVVQPTTPVICRT